MKAGDVFLEFLSTATIPELGPGPRDGVQSAQTLEASVRAAAETQRLGRREADAVRALILLWHDHHDIAHGIVQEMPTPEGSYVHAILHRREPDYGNAKYWFHRVGQHACYEPLAERAATLLAGSGGAALRGELLSRDQWDAIAFVNACERAANEEPGLSSVLREIQAEEFRILLTYLAGSELSLA
jgi:hypothetical protein